ncbi:hypothetical protein [Diplocloster modestus]|uniref:Uncharacterized protein n=1 Tax=Diplocloster modestus TaxID=2850322 RepID=A0ABS6K4P8_9FIRM|nr:hypothetical protein [Diplocloster modestus]MBU9725468.1 hypothetical protein [Diplocloster modestus]
MYESREYPNRIGLLLELEGYENGGISVWLDGTVSSPCEIAKACTVEEDCNSYMRDYVTDEKGELKEIRFDRIRNGNLD